MIIQFTIDEVELILEHLEELKNCWSWMEDSLPKYDKQYKELCDLIAMIKDKLSNSFNDD